MIKDAEKCQRYESLSKRLLNGASLSVEELEELLCLFTEFATIRSQMLELVDHNLVDGSQAKSSEDQCPVPLDYRQFMRECSSINGNRDVFKGLWDPAPGEETARDSAIDWTDWGIVISETKEFLGRIKRARQLASTGYDAVVKEKAAEALILLRKNERKRLSAQEEARLEVLMRHQSVREKAMYIQQTNAKTAVRAS